jgi:hypothetical protein
LSGPVTLTVDFAGIGSATTVARSDHDHWGEAWSGSGAGLTLESSDDDGIKVTGSSDYGDYGGWFKGHRGVYGHGTGGSGYGGYFKSDDYHGVHATGGSGAGDSGGWFEGYHGVYGYGTGADGYGGHFKSDQDHGVYVESTGTGYYGVHVESAGDDGVHVESAGGDGVEVGTAGNPSTTYDSLADNGFEVGGAEGNGLFVGQADDDGVYVYSAGDDGVYVQSAGSDGVHATGGSDNDDDYGGWFQGYHGVYGYGTGKNGYGGHFKSDDNHGIYVQGGPGVDDDGVYVTSAGDDGVHVQSATDDGVYVYSATDDGVYVQSAGGDGVHATGGSDDVDYGGWFEGYNGVYGRGTGTVIGTNGYGGHFISDHNHGIYVQGGTGSFDDGVHVASAGRDGVHVQSARGDGVHAKGGSYYGYYGGWFEGCNGVYGYSTGGYGGEHGGWFEGYHGVYGYGTGDNGYGGHFKSDANHGIYVKGGTGIYDDGVYVYSAGDDGVHASGDDVGVYANTTRLDHEWGFYTPDKIYAGTALASGGPMMFVAQNGDSRNLETGDVVAVSGIGAAFAGGDAPVLLVQEAGQANSTAAVGVVYRRFVAEEEVEEVEHEGRVERQTSIHASSTEGPIAPGDYLLIVVLGPAQVKADASLGSIRPGDLLTASSGGQAMKAEPVRVNGVEFYPPGTIIGKAMEPLDALRDTGLLWVMVTLH